MHIFTFLYTPTYRHPCTAGLFALLNTAHLLYTAFSTAQDRSTALLLFALNRALLVFALLDTTLLVFALLDTALLLYTDLCNTPHNSTLLYTTLLLYHPSHYSAQL